MSWNDLPSLGTATGTRVDSASKHIMACKVDTRLLMHMLADNSDPQNALHNEKMKYCMHKDEIVLNSTSTNDNAVTAYPMVVSTLGDITKEAQTAISSLYRKHDATQFFFTQDRIKNCKNTDASDYMSAYDASNPQHKEKWSRIHRQLSSLPNFRCQGVALGQAWASYLSGDTVASVLVGGMVTVLNGHFTMHTGDLVQWYFDFEQNEFVHVNKNNGCRVQPHDGVHSSKRAKYMDERVFGNSVKTGRHSGQKNTNAVFRIKSYKMKQIETDDQGPIVRIDHYGDKIRVFAKCISGGRPFDTVDIMLMTQSL